MIGPTSRIFILVTSWPLILRMIAPTWMTPVCSAWPPGSMDLTATPCPVSGFFISFRPSACVPVASSTVVVVVAVLVTVFDSTSIAATPYVRVVRNRKVPREGIQQQKCAHACHAPFLRVSSRCSEDWQQPKHVDTRHHTRTRTRAYTQLST